MNAGEFMLKFKVHFPFTTSILKYCEKPKLVAVEEQLLFLPQQ